jgi:molecular chaperone GrpE
MNGKEIDPLNIDHELPPADGSEEQVEQQQTSTQPVEAETELQKVKAENSELLQRMARMQAEFENAKRRAAREQQDFKEYALADAVRSLLPVLDSFDRALASNASGENFRAGMELIDRQFHDALARLGVTEIASQGQPFDPAQHEAIEMVATEETPDHHVHQELQKGYRLKDRLLRPAMVRVAKNPGN